MVFCKNCGYTYDITKDLEYFQKGGKIDSRVAKLVDKFKRKEEITENDVKNIKKHHIYSSTDYNQLKKNDKKNLRETLESIDERFSEESTTDETNSAHYICQFCGNFENIKPGTLIYSRTLNKSMMSQDEDYSYMADDPSLPRTRNYVCQYDDCETHSNPDLKEAVITHNSNHQPVYICYVCRNYWT